MTGVWCKVWPTGKLWIDVCGEAGSCVDKDSPLLFMECVVNFMRIHRNMWRGKSNKDGFPVVNSDGGLHYFFFLFLFFPCWCGSVD